MFESKFVYGLRQTGDLLRDLVEGRLIVDVAVLGRSLHGVSGRSLHGVSGRRLEVERLIVETDGEVVKRLSRSFPVGARWTRNVGGIANQLALWPRLRRSGAGNRIMTSLITELGGALESVRLARTGSPSRPVICGRFVVARADRN